MKLFSILLVVIVAGSVSSWSFKEADASASKSFKEAVTCTAEVCKLSNSCVCSLPNSPIETTTTPQFVVLSFDDAASRLIFHNQLTRLLFGRMNPDGNHIGATFYVPHEYTDYEVVNILYKKGFEIAVNSISKSASADYWATASQELLAQEFGGQKIILTNFANVNESHITGVRTPHFQINGQTTIKAYEESGLQYDNSWSTIKHLFPYTLDYKSSQECNIGVCPTDSFPGVFVAPINNLKSMAGVSCVSLLGCNAKGTVLQILDWLKENFANTYNANRAPFNLLVNSAWFAVSPNSFDALNQFLDYLGGIGDVYIISNQELIRWTLDPKPLGEYVSSEIKPVARCNKVTCPLKHNGETRYMVSCVPCPSMYPWVGHPLGEA